MCRRNNSDKWPQESSGSVESINDPSKPNALSPYDADIDKFFSNINDISDRFSEFTKKIVGQTYESHRNRHNWWNWHNERNQDSDYGTNKEVDQYLNRPYQTRDATWSRSESRLEELLKSPFELFDIFNESSGNTPYGLFSYQGPSPREYNTCMRKNGLSLWDSDGYWRCLFPNAEVPPTFLDYKREQYPDTVLTKDDFEEKACSAPQNSDGSIELGKSGTFFRTFEDYLKWKSSFFNKSSWRPKQASWDSSEWSDNKELEPVSKAADIGEKKVVGTSVQSFSNYENGEIVVKETKTDYFNDGTSLTNSVVKRKLEGADDWSTVEEKQEKDDVKHGWFWNKK